jgi:predicted nucleic acid-binding protein
MVDRLKGLIDTGAILAFLDRNDRWHQRCADVFRSIPLPLATSPAVLTEVFHLLRRNPQHYDSAWGLFRSESVRVLPIGEEDLSGLEGLMSRYRDRPMDFADATLVHLAHRENLETVFTIDHDDFETYRIDGKRRFQIVPAR